MYSKVHLLSVLTAVSYFKIVITYAFIVVTEYLIESFVPEIFYTNCLKNNFLKFSLKKNMFYFHKQQVCDVS